MPTTTQRADVMAEVTRRLQRALGDHFVAAYALPHHPYDGDDPDELYVAVVYRNLDFSEAADRTGAVAGATAHDYEYALSVHATPVREDTQKDLLAEGVRL